MATRTLLVTLGDANGLGPELVCRHFGALAAPSGRTLLIGPEAALTAHLGGEGPFWTRIEDPTSLSGKGEGLFLYQPDGLETLSVRPGLETPEGGLAAGLALEAACRLLSAGAAGGLVTAPLSKAALNAAGFDFPGHTEFLATRAGVGPDGVCMHLCGPRLRVSLATTHPRLSDVPRLVTVERIVRCLELTWRHVLALGVSDRPIAVCGVNPHAGEGGLIGDEEIRVVAPAVALARSRGVDAVGPLAADTLFWRAAEGEFSAVLAMYHDQGLPPLKLLHFHESVNVTLGLPYVRVSPGHGTGFELVGAGKAGLGSFRAALGMAGRLLAATVKD